MIFNITAACEVNLLDKVTVFPNESVWGISKYKKMVLERMSSNDGISTDSLVGEGNDFLYKNACSHTETEAADQACRPTMSQKTDTGPTGPSTAPQRNASVG